MKLHTYKCWDCGYHFSDKAINAPDCPKCKSSKTGMDCKIAIHGNYQHPIHSDALAISPTQIEEHKRLFPNIRLDKACRPIFEKFTDHEAYLKRCNIIKHPQKLKVKGKQIAKIS